MQLVGTCCRVDSWITQDFFSDMRFSLHYIICIEGSEFGSNIYTCGNEIYEYMVG